MTDTSHPLSDIRYPTGEHGYLALMQHLHEHGVYKPNRTGIGTFADVGHLLKFDLRDGFPAVTTKKLMFDAAKGELLGFWRGYDNAADFRALGCNIWNANANETPAWLENRHRKGTDDLGRIYGVQWTKWRDTRHTRDSAEAARLAAAGYEEIAFDSTRNVWVFEKAINQVEKALETLLADPYNRRIIVSGWRVDELDKAALPCCHVAYQWVALPDGTLHMTMWQRSADTLLGIPFNIATCAVFLEVMARLAGLKPAGLTIFLTDAHLYENHVEQVSLQLSREVKASPRLVLSDRIKPITDLKDVKGAFEKIEPSDIYLEGYEHHAAIKAPMAA